MAKEKKKNAHYIDNKQFLEAMKEWKQKCVDAEEAGEERPQVTNYIGECFLKIANGLSYRPNFINYTYRSEMVSDGIDKIIENRQYESFTVNEGDETIYDVQGFDPDIMLPDEDVYVVKKKEKKEKESEGLENFMETDKTT